MFGFPGVLFMGNLMATDTRIICATRNSCFTMLLHMFAIFALDRDLWQAIGTFVRTRFQRLAFSCRQDFVMSKILPSRNGAFRFKIPVNPRHARIFSTCPLNYKKFFVALKFCTMFGLIMRYWLQSSNHPMLCRRCLHGLLQQLSLGPLISGGTSSGIRLMIRPVLIRNFGSKLKPALLSNARSLCRRNPVEEHNGCKGKRHDCLSWLH